MFLPSRPSESELRCFVQAQQAEPLAYEPVGASRGTRAPRGYLPNFARTPLGTGGATYRRAVAALRRWAMYDMPWLRVLWTDAPIREGQTVGLLVHHYGFWSLHACRIVYTVNETGGPRERFGFGYGTLAQHAQRGEERFTVEWHRETDHVAYELFSYSRPGALLAWAGFPLARYLQKRFARESLQCMQRAARQS